MIFKKCFGLLVLCFGSFALGQEQEPLDVRLGEKLFREDRFAYTFYKNKFADVNLVAKLSDPNLDWLETIEGDFVHPQKGQHMSCSSCHFVDQPSLISSQFVFTYNDFIERTQIPHRDDLAKTTLRNSKNMVMSSVKKDSPLHWDGEFFSAKDLSCASLVGRNMGWRLKEAKLARKHIVQVIRQDNGNYPSDFELKGSYKKLLSDININIDGLSDLQVFESVCVVMATFLESLDFSRDQNGDFNGSAYDQFLQLNGIRTKANQGESPESYLLYIKDQLNFKKDWQWLNAEELKYHSHKSQFGLDEFKGMKAFFNRAQCVSCHRPPDFTDHGFHVTGISQMEYEKLHGKDSFTQLVIPNIEERNLMAQKYLMGTEAHPDWQGVYRQIPIVENSQFVDLGVWNLFAHPDMKKNQSKLKESICQSLRLKNCEFTPDEYLQKSVAMFSTPTLRSLGQSAPYFHNGMAKNFDEILKIYLQTSQMLKKNKLINADPILKGMQINEKDFPYLKAFMQSLDEDYD